MEVVACSIADEASLVRFSRLWAWIVSDDCLGAAYMRCCGMLGAVAERAGSIDSLSGFIVAFLIVMGVTAAWGDISQFIHLKPSPAPVVGSQEGRI
jgi:hypothetical protein